MGVVYYANYFIWFEVARTDWLRETGWSYREMEADGVSLPVIEAHCDYRQPSRYDDEIELRTRATLLSPIRIRFDYEVLRTGTILTTGHTVHGQLTSLADPAGYQAVCSRCSPTEAFRRFSTSKSRPVYNVRD